MSDTNSLHAAFVDWRIHKRGGILVIFRQTSEAQSFAESTVVAVRESLKGCVATSGQSKAIWQASEQLAATLGEERQRVLRLNHNTPESFLSAYVGGEVAVLAATRLFLSVAPTDDVETAQLSGTAEITLP